MDVKFDGMDELIDQLSKMETDVESGKQEALLKGAEVYQKAAKESAPVRTGNLEKHIVISDVKGDEIEVYVDQQGNAYYGYFLEYGTSKMLAQPFMGPAFNRSRNSMQQAMADSIWKTLGLM